MPTKEELLAKQTFKEYGIEEVEKRIFYTLSGDSQIKSDTAQVHRNSMAIALLYKNILDAGMLTEDQLDEILLEVTK